MDKKEVVIDVPTPALSEVYSGTYSNNSSYFKKHMSELQEKLLAYQETMETNHRHYSFIRGVISHLAKDAPDVDPELCSDRHKKLEDVIRKRFKGLLAGDDSPVDKEQLWMLVDDVTAKMATWIEELVVEADGSQSAMSEDESDMSEDESTESIEIGETLERQYSDVYEVTVRGSALVIENVKEFMQNGEVVRPGPIASDVEAWTTWMTNAIVVAEVWGGWIQTVVAEAEEKVKTGKETELNDEWRRSVTQEAMEMIRKSLDIQEMALKWVEQEEKVNT